MSDLVTANVAQIMDEVEREQVALARPSNLIVLSNGTEMEARTVPPLLAQKIEAKFRPPAVPKTYNEDKGRHEENPLDPEYLQRCEEIETEKNLALVDLLVGLGTKVIRVGADAEPFESADWRETVAFFLGEELPKSEKIQYLYWVKYVLIADNNDLQAIARKVAAKMGVPESAVGDALTELKSN
jgi:hypothetical protein